MLKETDKQAAQKELAKIFGEIMTAAGLPERPAQAELSKKMLAAMLDNNIALCEAGTGIGKTYAYLAAAFVFNKYRRLAGLPLKPICISTCSIALQEAIVKEYLPTLNRALLSAGLISKPAMAAVRKGKQHYACDIRLRRRLQCINQEKKNRQNLATLQAMQKQLDMDNVAKLSDFDKRQICVPRVCNCKKKNCRYMDYLDSCCSEKYLIQICNHNLLLADAIHRRTGKKPILPDCCCVIVDEAHKLPDTAREMFGYTLSAEDIEELCEMLEAAGYELAADNLLEAAQPLLKALAEPWDETVGIKEFMKPLNKMAIRLKVIKNKLRGVLPKGVRDRLSELVDIGDWLLSGPKNVMLYTVEAADGGTKLGLAPLNVGWLLGYRLWNRQQPFVLTSGTLSVAGDFSRFRKSAGLLDRYRVKESIAESPFDYEKNCLLYLPLKAPDHNSEKYFDELLAEIDNLIKAACGHTLVLFNSYADMSEIKERIKLKERDFSLYVMGRSRFNTAEQFKTQSGGVLLAAGSAWEGMDFPGDCVSLLIIPRLPFPVPDAKSEQEREQYENLIDFIESVVVPDMQIKLRQGFGRAIRSETDTCVIAILDERANPKNGRYFEAAQKTLPKMPITESLNDVAYFIRTVKPESYFQEATVCEC